MGYYWNAVTDRWDPIDHGRQLTPGQVRQIERRKALIGELINEIETCNDSAIILYAGLLARTLTCTDELLVREHAQRLADLMPDKKKSAA